LARLAEIPYVRATLPGVGYGVVMETGCLIAFLLKFYVLSTTRTTSKFCESAM